MKKLYPLKFHPILKQKIWGGEKMKQLANIDFAPLSNCGEAWLISTVEGSETVVSEGWLEGNSLLEIVQIYMNDLLGEDIYTKYGETFPLLVKLIDAKGNLSVQVHPDDIVAKERGLENGKSEMWYVMDADKGATLINGFNKSLSAGEFIERVEQQALLPILNQVEVVKGDVIAIPGKRIHAVGEGVFVAEIQQASDTTYRVYDWGRTDENGNARDLHLQESIGSLDFSALAQPKVAYSPVENGTSTMVKTPHFQTNIVVADDAIQKDYSELDSFVIYLCVEGKVEIGYDHDVVVIRQGEAILIPAIINNIVLNPIKKTTLLEVYAL